MNIVLPTIDLPCLETLGGLANENIYLKNMVLQGAEKLYDCPLPKTISDRINHELQIIERKKLANYFLIYNDLVQTATETFHILIAPGHHCVASSFVSYCLGITRLNPIEHGLLFERFLSTGRNAMPEIFIASECGGQTKLLDYIKKKYVEANEYNSNSIDDTNSITISFYELQELSQIQSILHFIKTSKYLDIDIDSILPDDLRTLRSFSNGDTMFIPFFDSVHMQDILRSLDNVSFDDLVALYTMHQNGIE